jgi:hypothetical protein
LPPPAAFGFSTSLLPPFFLSVSLSALIAAVKGFPARHSPVVLFVLARCAVFSLFGASPKELNGTPGISNDLS